METPETDRAATRPPRRWTSFARAALLSLLPVLLVAIGCAGTASTTHRARRRRLPSRPLTETPATASVSTPATAATFDDAERAALAERTRAELLHAWRAYERLAWGHDELRPLSRAPRDWYGESLLMTPVDSLDTLLLAGLDAEATKAHQLIVDKLSFDRDLSVQVFEVTIRLLGGLLAGYQMTGDPRLLTLADDLGTRLLPAFESPTGMPYRYVHLRTGLDLRPAQQPGRDRHA